MPNYYRVIEVQTIMVEHVIVTDEPADAILTLSAIKKAGPDWPSLPHVVDCRNKILHDEGSMAFVEEISNGQGGAEDMLSG